LTLIYDECIILHEGRQAVSVFSTIIRYIIVFVGLLFDILACLESSRYLCGSIITFGTLTPGSVGAKD
jgi:hypothetical protein